MLIENGDINYYRRDESGRAPVHVAGEKVDGQILEMMSNDGADLCIPDADGNTVLHYVCMGAV